MVQIDSNAAHNLLDDFRVAALVGADETGKRNDSEEVEMTGQMTGDDSSSCLA